MSSPRGWYTFHSRFWYIFAFPSTVGKRGSIIIAAEKVAEMEIGKDDKFKVRKTKAGIALKKV